MYVRKIKRIVKNFLRVLAVRPETVQILGDRSALSAGKHYRIRCASSGARPAATITWWKNNKFLGKTESTVSTYEFRIKFIPPHARFLSVSYKRLNVNRLTIGIYAQTHLNVCSISKFNFLRLSKVSEQDFRIGQGHSEDKGINASRIRFRERQPTFKSAKLENSIEN